MTFKDLSDIEREKKNEERNRFNQDVSDDISDMINQVKQKIKGKPSFKKRLFHLILNLFGLVVLSILILGSIALIKLLINYSFR